MCGKITGYFFYMVLFIENIKIYDVNAAENDEKPMPTTDLIKEVMCKKDINVCQYYKPERSVCVLRNSTRMFLRFSNNCYFVFASVCDYSSEDIFIVPPTYCDVYSAVRRNEESSKNAEKLESNEGETSTVVTITQAPNLRQKLLTTTPVYPVEEAYDGHPCPLSCVHVYNPVCLNVNRGYGKYFKYLTFMNHCMADLYYCRHPDEFNPPPDPDLDPDELLVHSSSLGWSFCGSSRYMQFARFSEVTSAMGHFGWLAGKYRYSHIMEPNERLPNYG